MNYLYSSTTIDLTLKNTITSNYRYEGESVMNPYRLITDRHRLTLCCLTH